MSWSVFITGFLLQTSLLVAIGAQNSFVLRQGLSGQYVGLVVWFCIISDLLLAALAVYGLGNITALHPRIMIGFQISAILFLMAYAGISMKRAIGGTI
jgi:L-lysine exporter family protein LysE/ArgO